MVSACDDQAKNTRTGAEESGPERTGLAWFQVVPLSGGAPARSCLSLDFLLGAESKPCLFKPVFTEYYFTCSLVHF